MQRLSLIIQGSPYPADIVQIIPMPEGRLAVHISVAVKLNRGESCILRNEFGRDLHCVVSNSEPSGSFFAVELRCIADEGFTTAGDVNVS